MIKKRFFHIFLGSFLFATIFIQVAYPAAVPFPAGNPLSVPQFKVYKAALDAWAATEEGKEFFADNKEIFLTGVPSSLPEFKASKIGDKYAAWKEAKQAEKEGAGSKLGGNLKPVLKAELGLDDVHFEGSAEDVMQNVALAARKKRELAEKAEEFQKKAEEGEHQKALIAKQLGQKQQEAVKLEREAEERRVEKEVLEARHLGLKQRAAEAGMDVGLAEEEIERQIIAKLERMREANALANALDALRFLTHYVQSQEDIDVPLVQVGNLNAKARLFESALNTRRILEKDESLVPIAQYFDIPFFDEDAYEGKFNTPTFKALQAWQVLQTSSKLTDASLAKIKTFATLSKKARLEEQEKRELEATKKEVQGFIDIVEKDLLWQAFQQQSPLYYDEIYFWYCVKSLHQFNQGSFTEVKNAAEIYAHFSTNESLKRHAEAINSNKLRLTVFKVESIKAEQTAAAKNFCLFDDLNKASSELMGKNQSYERALQADFEAAAVLYLQKLTKLRFDAVAELVIPNIFQSPKAVIIEDLKKLEKLSFCVSDADEKAAPFGAISIASSGLLQTISSFVDHLKIYVTDFHQKLQPALAGGGGAILGVKVLDYKRPVVNDVHVVQPVSLQKSLAPVMEVSDQEKEAKKLDTQIAKLQKDLGAKEEIRRNQRVFDALIALLKEQDAVIKANFGPRGKFSGQGKLSSQFEVKKEEVPAEIFLFFKTLEEIHPDLLPKVLELGIIDLQHNYDGNATLNAKEVMKCLKAFANGNDISDAQLKLTAPEQVGAMQVGQKSVSIRIPQFFYYICDEFNKKLQAAMKNAGESDLEKVLHHLDGLKNTLERAEADAKKADADQAAIKADIKRVLEENSFKTSVEKSAPKIKFKVGSLIRINIKGVPKDMEPGAFLKLLPKLIDVYTAEPIAPMPIIPVPAVDAGLKPLAPVIGRGAPPPPPPPPRLGPPVAPPLGPPNAPPPPVGLVLVPAVAKDPVLGVDITLPDLIKVLGALSDGELAAMAIKPEDQLLQLNTQRDTASGAITPERKAFMTMTSANGEQIDKAQYELLRDKVTADFLVYFKAIKCTDFLNLKDYSDTFIVKFYNEFMQCLEFVLWNKIHLFGTEIKERLLKEAGAEIERQKLEFIRVFNDRSLNVLMEEKLIKIDKANGIGGQVLPIDHLKLALPEYQEVIDKVDLRTEVVFGQIIENFIKILEAKKAAKAHGAMAVKAIRAEEDPLSQAINKLKKLGDVKYLQTKQRIDKGLKSFSEIYDQLNAKDVYGLIDQYVAAFKAKSVDLPRIKENLQVLLNGGDSLTGIAYDAMQYKGGAVVTNIIYDFFKGVVEEFVKRTDGLTERLDAIKIKEDEARAKFTARYFDGGKIDQFTVMNVLQNDERILPRIFISCYEILAEKGDGSHLDFAAYVIKEFLDKFPAFLREEVNTRLYSDDAGAGQKQDADQARLKPDADQRGAQQADPSRILEEKLKESATTFEERYRQLETVPPADLERQKILLVLEFIESTGMVDPKKAEKEYQKEMQGIKDLTFKEFPPAMAKEMVTFKNSVVKTFEDKQLKELLAQKPGDPRIVEILKLYDDKSQKQAIESLKRIQKSNYNLDLLKHLDKFATAEGRQKSFWLEKQLDALCVQGQKVFDFAKILNDLVQMPEDQFLDNFFGRIEA